MRDRRAVTKPKPTSFTIFGRMPHWLGALLWHREVKLKQVPPQQISKLNLHFTHLQGVEHSTIIITLNDENLHHEMLVSCYNEFLSWLAKLAILSSLTLWVSVANHWNTAGSSRQLATQSHHDMPSDWPQPAGQPQPTTEFVFLCVPYCRTGLWPLVLYYVCGHRQTDSLSSSCNTVAASGTEVQERLGLR